MAEGIDDVRDGSSEVTSPILIGTAVANVAFGGAEVGWRTPSDLNPPREPDGSIVLGYSELYALARQVRPHEMVKLSPGIIVATASEEDTESAIHNLVDGLQLDTVLQQLIVRREAIRLSPLQYRILTFFVEHKGQLVSQDEIEEAVWGEDAMFGHSSRLACQLTRIRRVLGEYAWTIQNCHNRGWVFTTEHPEESIDAG